MPGSRLDSVIRRLQAQRASIDHASRLIEKLEGPVLELGLGNGRTYDHLRKRLPTRAIWVFERDPKPHPDCMPPDDRLVVGDLEATLPSALERVGARAALIHSDIGTGDPARNRRTAMWLSSLLPDLLVEGGYVLSDQELQSTRLAPRSPPDVDAGRYFFYQGLAAA